MWTNQKTMKASEIKKNKEYPFYHKSLKDYYRDFNGYCKVVKDDDSTCLVEFEDYWVKPRKLNQRIVMRIYTNDIPDYMEYLKKQIDLNIEKRKCKMLQKWAEFMDEPFGGTPTQLL
jgi:hypothetical protein